MPWGELEELVRPCYYEGKRGNNPTTWSWCCGFILCKISTVCPTKALEMKSSTAELFSDFCGVESSNQIPDGDTIGRFRNLLINNHLHEKFFALVVKKPDRPWIDPQERDDRGFHHHWSTKFDQKQGEAAGSGCPLGEKGADWRFGYKAHIGVDKDSGIVHTLEVTGANEHDVSMTSKLLTGEEEVVYGDNGYLGAEKREDAVVKNKQGKKSRYKVNRRPSQYKKNSKRSQAQVKRREREKSSVRAKVEHVFTVVKEQLRYRKTRYRGLRKQTAKLHMLFALANLILADRPSCLVAWFGIRADIRKRTAFPSDCWLSAFFVHYYAVLP